MTTQRQGSPSWLEIDSSLPLRDRNPAMLSLMSVVALKDLVAELEEDTAGFEVLEGEHLSFQKRLIALRKSLKGGALKREEELKCLREEELAAHVDCTREFTKALREAKEDLEERTSHFTQQQETESLNELPALVRFADTRSKFIETQLQSQSAADASLARLAVESTVTQEETEMLRGRVEYLRKRVIAEEEEADKSEAEVVSAEEEARDLQAELEKKMAVCAELKQVEAQISHCKSDAVRIHGLLRRKARHLCAKGRLSGLKDSAAGMAGSRKESLRGADERDDSSQARRSDGGCGISSGGKLNSGDDDEEDYREMWCSKPTANIDGNAATSRLRGLLSGSLSVPELTKPPKKESLESVVRAVSAETQAPAATREEAPYGLPFDFTALSRRVNNA